MSNTTNTLKRGDRIAISKGPGIIHYGIYIGFMQVVDNSKTMGKVVIRSLVEFADGKQIRTVPTIAKFPPEEVVRRARSRVGKPYGWFSQNCEHFVNEVQTGVPKSTQAFVAGGLMALVIWRVLSK